MFDEMEAYISSDTVACLLRSHLEITLKRPFSNLQVNECINAVLPDAQQLYYSYLKRASFPSGGDTDKTFNLWNTSYAPTCLPEMACHVPSAYVVQQWLKGWWAGQSDPKDVSTPEGSTKGSSSRSSKTKTPSTMPKNDSPAFPSTLSGTLSAFKLPSSAPELTSYKALILVGPHGSGKTMTVYTFCAEMGYRVIEINPSIRRTGKSVLHLFKEATQSYALITRDSSTPFDIWRTLPAVESHPDEPSTQKKRSWCDPEDKVAGKRAKKEEVNRSPKKAVNKGPSNGCNALLAFLRKVPVPAEPAKSPPKSSSSDKGKSVTTVKNVKPKNDMGRSMTTISKTPTKNGITGFFEPRTKANTSRAPGDQGHAKGNAEEVLIKEPNSMPLPKPKSPKSATDAKKSFDTEEGKEEKKVKKQKTNSEPLDDYPAVTWLDMGIFGVKQDPGVQENTVILFDEADVCFDDEQGFLSALRQFIDDNKCPVILTCNKLIPELLDDDNILQVPFDPLWPSPPVTLVSPFTTKWITHMPHTENPLDGQHAASVEEKCPTQHPARKEVKSNPRKRNADANQEQMTNAAPANEPSGSCCKYLFGAELHLQLLMMSHGIELHPSVAQNLLHFYKYDMRRVLMELQLWTNEHHQLPIAWSSQPSALSPQQEQTSAKADDLLERTLGFHPWIQWWHGLRTQYSQGKQGKNGAMPMHRSQLRALANTCRPHISGAALRDWDLLFHNYHSLLPAELHALFAALPPISVGIIHVKDIPGRESEEVQQPCSESSSPPTIEVPEATVTSDAATAGESSPAESLGTLEIGLNVSIPEAEAEPEEDGKSLISEPAHGEASELSVDDLIVAAASRARREAEKKRKLEEERKKIMRARFFEKRTSQDVPHDFPVAPEDTAADVPPAASKESDMCSSSFIESPTSKPKRERRPPERFTVLPSGRPPFIAQCPTAQRASKSRKTGNSSAPRCMDVKKLRQAVDVLECLAGMAEVLSSNDVLYRGMSHPHRLVNTPAYWRHDPRFPPSPEVSSSSSANCLWSHDLEHGHGPSHPFPLVEAEVWTGTQALTLMLRHIQDTVDHNEDSGPAVSSPSAPTSSSSEIAQVSLTGENHSSNLCDSLIQNMAGTPESISSEETTASCSSGATSHTSKGGRNRLPAVSPRVNPARGTTNEATVSDGLASVGCPQGSGQRYPGALSFATALHKLAHISCSPIPSSTTGWENTHVVWTDDEGFTPLLQLHCGLWMAHHDGWYYKSGNKAQAAVLKRLMPGLIPHHPWHTSQLYTDVIPHLAAVCHSERLREARGRRKSKFSHYLGHLAPDVRDLLLAYALAKPTHTASGHPLN